jgi:hypothetical protein
MPSGTSTRQRETIDEHQIEAEWPYLKQKLNIAEQQFREFHPPIASCIGPKRFANSPFNPMVTPQDIKEALEALVSPKRKKKQKLKPIHRHSWTPTRLPNPPRFAASSKSSTTSRCPRNEHEPGMPAPICGNSGVFLRHGINYSHRFIG